MKKRFVFEQKVEVLAVRTSRYYVSAESEEDAIKVINNYSGLDLMRFKQDDVHFTGFEKIKESSNKDFEEFTGDSPEIETSLIISPELTSEQFKEMFFKMATAFPYEHIEEAKERANNSASYLEKLQERCCRISDRYCIDEHDALFYLMSRGKVR